MPNERCAAQDRPLVVGSEPTQRWAAVLGSPIRHSLSPTLHRAAYAALGLTSWRYEAFDCDEAALPTFLERLGPEWAGLSLTMPLKRVALTVADEVSPLASAVGAANTLVLGQPAGRRAENTDVAGILAALREAGLDRVGAAVILGAGGTAQAALAALRELGETTPTVLVRDPARTTDLRAAADRLGVQPTICGGLSDDAVPEADVIISTLPPGAADALNCQQWGAAQWATRPVVLDVVYTPWPTPLAASALAAGCRIVSGLAVLLHQAVAQVHLMTGRCAPVTQMRAALDAAVRFR
ncbi:MAG TPA: shikimate dehydrogenase [Pseudonocardiaceae bacterium]|nr:shikimate dehydrogenase [Pseudonocardiaceae bacterium]